MAMKDMVALLVLSLLAVAVSGQGFDEFAPAPAPTMDTGAGFSLGMSGAVICSSLFLSILAFLKN